MKTKIAVLGAESTGKSTLAAALATSLNAALVPELLRAWVDEKQRTPTQSEQCELVNAQRQKEHELCAMGTNEIIVCDTTPLSIALNSVLYFNDHSLIADAIAYQRGYAIQLLCEPDLPWVADGMQRESPQMQARFHALLTHTLQAHGIQTTRVAGVGEARVARAIAAVQWLLES